MMSKLSLFSPPDLENVKEVTSAEYHYDPQCHISTHEEIINDVETIETFRYWINNYSHIIKVRATFLEIVSDSYVNDRRSNEIHVRVAE